MQFFALLTRNTQKFTDADFAPLLPGEAEQRRSEPLGEAEHPGGEVA